MSDDSSERFSFEYSADQTKMIDFIGRWDFENSAIVSALLPSSYNTAEAICEYLYNWPRHEPGRKDFCSLSKAVEELLCRGLRDALVERGVSEKYLRDQQYLCQVAKIMNNFVRTLRWSGENEDFWYYMAEVTPGTFAYRCGYHDGRIPIQAKKRLAVEQLTEPIEGVDPE